jgi:hypothetical protein
MNMSDRRTTLKVRMEYGPGLPIELSRFTSGDAFKATLKALAQLLTSGDIYPGPDGAQIAVFGEAEVSLQMLKAHAGATTSLPSVVTHDFELSVALRDPGSGDPDA